jgi:hypothetical protein
VAIPEDHVRDVRNRDESQDSRALGPFACPISPGLSTRSDRPETTGSRSTSSPVCTPQRMA